MNDHSTTQSDNQNDIDLVHKLFIRHSLAIRGYLLALNPDINQVDDLMHSVFLSITKKASLYNPEKNFATWARGFAKIELLRSLRQKSRLPMSLSPEIIESLSEAAPMRGPDSQQMAYVTECLKELAPQAKKTIEFRYLQGLRPSAIAEKMKIAVASVNVTLSRARDMLRKCVQRKQRSQGEDL